MRWKPGLRRTGWHSYSEKPGSRSGEESLEEAASTLDAVLATFLGQALTQIPWIQTPSVPKLQSPLQPLLGSFNGVRMGFPTWLSGKESACQRRRHGFDPRVWKISWRRKCNPLQYSCLGNPMDRGAWRATVHGITKSRTWMKQLSMHACSGVSIGEKPLQREVQKCPHITTAPWLPKTFFPKDRRGDSSPAKIAICSWFNIIKECMSLHENKSCHNHGALTTSQVQQYLTHETLARHATEEGRQAMHSDRLGFEHQTWKLFDLGQVSPPGWALCSSS